MFITFEGIDGSGKSTQARHLAGTLRDAGHSVVLTREPGGSDGAEEIRRLLVEGAPNRWSAETEILLFTAARVYQGATRGDLRATVDLLHARMIGIEPDLTFVIDMDPHAALTRGLARQSGEDRFEDFGIAFQSTLRRGFLDLALSAPGRCRVIDGNRTADTVAADIAALIPQDA
jgi:dTMP kinase